MNKLALLLVALVACSADTPVRSLSKPGEPPASVADLPECRNVHAQIAGHVASIYRARAPEAEFFVLVVDADPACATDEAGVNESGVIPGDAPVEARRCPICDGDPMPDDAFPGL